jgi:hypothetical protein
MNNTNGVDIFIDLFTECLEDRKTRKKVLTRFDLITNIADLKNSKRQGWNFNWIVPYRDGYDIYRLRIIDEERVEGLIALKPSKEKQAVVIDIIESAPHNIGKNGEYIGVGAHLFAIACLISLKSGYEGFVCFTAKTNLIEHYQETLGAQQIGNSQDMFLNTAAALKLISIYFPDKIN